jgi:DNA-directed RNA polymerase sigma subunit (sigma70/sigma32)
MINLSIDNRERDRKILALLAEKPKLSNEAIGAKFGISRTRVAQIQNAEMWRQSRRKANERIATKFRTAFEKYEKIRQDRLVNK